MKVDLTTAIISAIVGVVAAYLITSNIIQNPAPVVIKTLDATVSTDLAEPNTEVFNYRALNPTVEVFIDCTNYDASGSCMNNTENN